MQFIFYNIYSEAVTRVAQLGEEKDTLEEFIDSLSFL